MATSLKSLSEYSSKNILDISAKKFAIVVSEWNEEVTEALYSGAFQTLLQHGAKKENIIRKNVPGSFELSLAAQWCAQDEDIDAVIDFRAVFQQTFDQLAYEDMRSLLKPKTGKLGLQDHGKVFCVDHKGLGNIYDMRGINRDKGCLIVVRPDQYVAHVLPLDGFEALSAYFAGVLR